MADEPQPEDNRGDSHNYYPPTNHPEDLPSYGQTSRWAEGEQGQQIPDDPAATSAPDAPHKIQTVEGFRWALGAVFRSWKLWIVLGLLYLLIMAGTGIPRQGLSVDAQMNQMNMVLSVGPAAAGIIVFFLTPLVYNAALRNVDHGSAGWADLKENVNYGPVLGMIFVSGLIPLVLGTVIGLVALVPAIYAASSGADQEQTAIAAAFGVFLALALLMVLIGPFFVFWPWVMVDRRASFGQAIKLGFSLGKANWGRLILFSLCFTLGSAIAALVTFGVAILILGPLQCLIDAHFYRQAVDGLSPGTEHDTAVPNR